MTTDKSWQCNNGEVRHNLWISNFKQGLAKETVLKSNGKIDGWKLTGLIDSQHEQGVAEGVALVGVHGHGRLTTGNSTKPPTPKGRGLTSFAPGDDTPYLSRPSLGDAGPALCSPSEQKRQPDSNRHNETDRRYQARRVRRYRVGEGSTCITWCTNSWPNTRDLVLGGERPGLQGINIRSLDGQVVRDVEREAPWTAATELKPILARR